MSGSTTVTRVAAALGVVALVAIAGYGSFQDRRERADAAPPPPSVAEVSRDAPPDAVTAPPATDEPAGPPTVAGADAATPVLVVPVPPADAPGPSLRRVAGCWTQGGMTTDGEVGARVSLRYCLDPEGQSGMTLEQGGEVRCNAAVLAQPLGARVRLAMTAAPDCAFGAPLPLFDALCDEPAGDEMACDIDWGGGLVETFRLRRT